MTTYTNDEARATALLERLGGTIDVGVPPVDDVIARGGRGRRHRVLQVGSIAAGVLLLAGGISWLGPQLADEGSSPAASEAGYPGLAGTWRPTALDGSAAGSSLGVLKITGAGPRHIWGAEDDCNHGSGTMWVTAAGVVVLGQIALTQMGCGSEAPYTVFDAMEHTKRLAIRSELILYDGQGRAIGRFVRVLGTARPPHDAPGSPQSLPGRPPSRGELLGSWHWIKEPPPSSKGTTMDPALLDFHNPLKGNGAVEGVFPALSWSAYAGCNNFASGEFRLDSDGGYTTRHINVSDLMCTVAPKPGERFPASVVQPRGFVRLVDGRLQFYDDAGNLRGTFTRG